ncbi:hypothetical protein FLAV_00633 [Flavobacteriales bacterium]|nr:hypothetical protein [Flavobacteriales bacterium]MCL4815398.1 hypothetical protein [Flavobacteriales bacterium]WKZ75017.1 MAG: hypothetical protein QY303_12810 [Vicingaceae bacterium]GIK69959.1 MAG: hypothetical protein BroJett020_12540 [Bacteroidota bacterium]CAG0959715.1 hypothetical protein FLAV_00633 [Flavobacteriales bacterium]
MEKTLHELEEELKKLGEKKSALIKEKAYEAAAIIRDLQEEIMKKINKINTTQHPPEK